MASENPNPAVATLLLDRGADINATTSKGTTTLISAVHAYNLEMVETLLDRGADVRLEGEGGTPCRNASRRASFDGSALLDRLCPS